MEFVPLLCCLTIKTFVSMTLSTLSRLTAILACIVLSVVARSVHGQAAPQIYSFEPKKGNFYTTMIIKGKNFSNYERVLIGGNMPASTNLVSDSVFEIFIGDGASGAVTVIGKYGTASMDGFTFIPPPTLMSFSPAGGGRGDTIFLKGVGFQNGAIPNVTFGDVDALKFAVTSDSSIWAIVGDGASGDIAVYSDIFWHTDLGPFEYRGPLIERFSPTSGGAGTVVTIRGKWLTGVNAVSFGGVPAASVNVLSDSVLTATVGAGGRGDIVVSSSGGHSSLPGFNIAYLQQFEPAAASTYDTVLLHGNNFTGVNAVSFDGVPAASFSVLSDSLLSAVVGFGGSGAIKIVRASDSMELDGFTYVPYQPKISSFANSVVTLGTPVTIRGRHFRGVQTVRFGGTPVASFTIVSDSVIAAVADNGSTGYVFVGNPVASDSMAGLTFKLYRPTIEAVSPAGAVVGSSVVLTGYGFSKTLAANAVAFGTIQAVVLKGSDSSLTVVVPPGASTDYISVNRDRLTGFSPKPFQVLLPGGVSQFRLDDPLRLRVTGRNPVKMVSADFDGDGKVDIASIYEYTFPAATDFLSVWRNTSADTAIHFGPEQQVPLGTTNYSGMDIAVADMDGDRKPDIVLVSRADDRLIILKNTSTTGSIAFERMDIDANTLYDPLDTSVGALAAKDFDGDGRVDIAISNPTHDGYYQNRCRISPWLNITTDSVIRLNQQREYHFDGTFTISSTDLNNDGLPDLAMTEGTFASWATRVRGLRNISSPRILGFQAGPVAGTTSTDWYSEPVFGDLDNDNKTDMITADGRDSSISIFRNISRQGDSILFEAARKVSLPGDAVSALANDYNGDGYADILALSNDAGKGIVWFLKNKGGGGFAFDTVRLFTLPAMANRLLTTDLDNDGKPDLLVSLQNDSIAVFKNHSGLVLLCPGGTTVLKSDVSGGTYQWQVSSNKGVSFSAISNGGNYSGAGSAALTIIGAPSSFSGNRYRCVVDGANGSAYTIRMENRWVGAVDQFWTNPANWSCGVLPDINSDVVIGSGTVVLTSNASVNRLTVLPGVNFVVNAGVVLTVME